MAFTVQKPHFQTPNRTLPRPSAEPQLGRGPYDGHGLPARSEGGPSGPVPPLRAAEPGYFLLPRFPLGGFPRSSHLPFLLPLHLRLFPRRRCGGRDSLPGRQSASFQTGLPQPPGGNLPPQTPFMTAARRHGKGTVSGAGSPSPDLSASRARHLPSPSLRGQDTRLAARRGLSGGSRAAGVRRESLVPVPSHYATWYLSTALALRKLSGS